MSVPLFSAGAVSGESAVEVLLHWQQQLFWPDLRKPQLPDLTLCIPLKSANCRAPPEPPNLHLQHPSCIKAVTPAFIEHLLLSIKGEVLVFCHLNLSALL